jgi:hypothetical protein
MKQREFGSWMFLAFSGALLMGGNAMAADPRSAIYTCTDAKGKKLTSDRLIPECRDGVTKVLNADGSLRSEIGPTLTAEQVAEKEAAARAAAAVVAAQKAAVRGDNSLMARFPNEAAHRKARNAALDEKRSVLKGSEARLELLAKERKPLDDEAEFYNAKTMPAKLKRARDANETSAKAQRDLIQNQQIELQRINNLYDVELERLKKLWRGAPAGSLGPQPVGDASAESASAAASK